MSTKNAITQYAVIGKGEPALFDGRRAAVQHAKELSLRRGRARVECKDGRMEMQFVQGSVTQYRLGLRR